MRVINPQKVSQAELVVGIPSYNEAETIEFVTKRIIEGLEKYFSGKRSVIINADGSSDDGTRDIFLRVKSRIPKICLVNPKSKKGKGYNFYNLFLMMNKLGAKVGITLDADLKSIKPDWIKNLSQPILKGYDYVFPYYIRKRDDATITNHLVYPLVYGLLGLDVRQAIGGDFAFSRKLVDLWLEQKWPEGAKEYGVDIFMSLTAYFSKAKLVQVNLGAKIHSPSTPGLEPMFIQVGSTLFRIINLHRSKLNKIKKVKKVSVLGGKKLPVLKGGQPNYKIFRKIFLEKFPSNKEIFKTHLSPELYQELERNFQTKDSAIETDLWTKAVYDLLYAFNNSNFNLSIIEAMKCLYFGRVASFLKKTIHLSPLELEKEIKKQAEYFFRKRDYFLKKYTRT